MFDLDLYNYNNYNNQENYYNLHNQHITCKRTDTEGSIPDRYRLHHVHQNRFYEQVRVEDLGHRTGNHETHTKHVAASEAQVEEVHVTEKRQVLEVCVSLKVHR